MQFFKYALVFAICFALLDPTEGGWLRKAWRKAKNSVRKVVKKIKKAGCKLLYRVACPVALTAAGAAISASTSGVGDLIVGAGVALGKKACHVRQNKCKRSVSNIEITYPFSDELSDYDLDGDKEITYEEFVITVMTSVNLEDPSELAEPFIWADADGNGKLDIYEFIAAPFLFARTIEKSSVHRSTRSTPSQVDGVRIVFCTGNTKYTSNNHAREVIAGNCLMQDRCDTERGLAGDFFISSLSYINPEPAKKDYGAIWKQLGSE